MLKSLFNKTGDTAPEGFTEKVMALVAVERITPKSKHESPVKLSTVMGILAVTIASVVITGILHGRNPSETPLPILQVISERARSLLPDIQANSKHGITLPMMFVYLSASLFLLMIFDGIVTALLDRKKRH